MAANRWEGKVLGGRYQIEALLGQGGMSAVYRAKDPNLQRTVAIKLIHPHLSDNLEFVQRFESEATAIARLRHPNIVQVFDFNHDGDLYYMVLEFVAGETLQSRIKRLNAAGRHLPLRDALRYTDDICKAADYAHQRGMIHRDIKPANVMLDVNGNAILMDFGIARILGGQAHTATGAVLGTALYMSPEQIQGLHPDARADIYSIGVMLFESLGGHPPFEADSAMTLMMMHLNDPVPDLANLHPAVPAEVKEIVNRALEKDRNKRFQSAAEMSAALGHALISLPAVETTPLPPPLVKAEPPPAPQETIIEKTPVPPAVIEEVPEKVEEAAAPPVPAPEEVKLVLKEAAAPPPESLKTVIETPPHVAASEATLIEPPSQPIKKPAVSEPIAKPVAKPPAAVERPVTASAEPILQAVPAAAAKKKGLPTWQLAVIGLLALGLLGGGGFLISKLAGPNTTPNPTLPIAAVVEDTATSAPPTAAPTFTSLPIATSALLPTDTPQPEPTATEILPTATTAPVVIGGADKIAYLSSNDVWVANLDGTEMTQLTSDGTIKTYLRWLPGGQGLSYLSGKCIHTVDLAGSDRSITCFNYSDYLDAFEVSPDGKHVALSLDRQLYILPFDLERLALANSHPDLEALADCPELAPYQRNSAIAARWSSDSSHLAALALGVLDDGRRGEIVQVFAVDRCIANPALNIQFPPPHFTFSEYQKSPTLPGLTWDGDVLFAMNGNTRNEGFGELHLFNTQTYKASISVNPINNVCCYRDPSFSPDGQYLLVAFQDITLGADSVTQLYLIPYGTIGSGATYQPLPLPIFTNPREAPRAVLRPAVVP